MDEQIPKYGVIHYDVLKILKLKPAEYCLMYMIECLSRKTGWCWKSKVNMGELLRFSKQGMLDMIERLIQKGLLEHYAPQSELLRPTEKWLSAVRPYRPKGKNNLLELGEVSLPTGGKESLPNSNSSDNHIDSSRFKNETTASGVIVESNRSEEELGVFHLFSREPRAWWQHKQQKDAALRLVDTFGMKQVTAAMMFVNRHRDKSFCPVVNRPFQLEAKWDDLLSFGERNGYE